MQQSIKLCPEPHARLRDMQLHVVGCRHHITDEAKRQKFLDEAPMLSMFMACEPTNPYDPQAIAVYVNSEPIAMRVAYISTENLPKAHGILDAYHTTWMPIHALGLQPGRHTTLLAYPLGPGGEMITDIEETVIPDEPAPRQGAIFRQGSGKGGVGIASPARLRGAGSRQGNAVTAGELPGEADKYWARLQGGGFTDAGHHLAPQTTRAQAAYIADCFADKLGIRSKWKTFERLWGIKNLAQEKWKMQETGKEPSRSREIRAIFSD